MAKNVAKKTPVNVGRTFYLSGDSSPTALTGAVNDYGPAGTESATVLRIDGGASSRNITGFANGSDGRVIIVVNIGATADLVLKVADTGSVEANRMLLPNAADITIRPTGAAILIYDATSSRWRCAASAA